MFTIEKPLLRKIQRQIQWRTIYVWNLRNNFAEFTETILSEKWGIMKAVIY